MPGGQPARPGAGRKPRRHWVADQLAGKPDLAGQNGAAPLGVSLEVPESCGGQIATDDLGAHNTLMSYGYVLGRAAHNKSRISILDWGGGPGHYYLIGRALLPRPSYQ